MASARLAPHQKGARRSGRAIAFLDETGSTFRSRLGTTWAPIGVFPILERLSKRREVSSIVAVTAPLDGAPSKVVARHFIGSIHEDEVIEALKYFRRRLGVPLILVWDRLAAHRSSKVRRFVEEHSEDFQIEWLPAYAPDLNPEEVCNSMVKADMLNATPNDVQELRRMARRSFRRLQHRTDELRSSFEHAGLHL
ncbi:transposase [Pyxidicoccus sp. 3LG]